MTRFILALALVLMARTAAASGRSDRWDWDRYHARRDACAQLDQCTRGSWFCSDTERRVLQRQCSPWQDRR